MKIFLDKKFKPWLTEIGKKMSTQKFRKLEEFWDLLENEDKDLISAGLEKLLNPKKTIYVDPASTLRLNDLFTFTVHNF